MPDPMASLATGIRTRIIPAVLTALGVVFLAARGAVVHDPCRRAVRCRRHAASPEAIVDEPLEPWRRPSRRSRRPPLGPALADPSAEPSPTPADRPRIATRVRDRGAQDRSRRSSSRKAGYPQCNVAM